MFNPFKKKKKRAKEEIKKSKEDRKESEVEETEAPAEEEASAAGEESPAEPLASTDETAGSTEAAAEAAAAEAAAAEAAAEEILSADEAAGVEPAGVTESVAVMEVEETEAQAEVDEAAAEEKVEAAEEEEKEEEKEEKEEKPRSMVTLVTMVLTVFNILAACAFAFLLLMDNQKRQAWEYASLVHDLILWGVPLEEQDSKSTNSDVLHPPIILSQEQIAAEHKARKTPVQIPAKDFRDVNEVLKSSIKPSKLNKQLLKDLFQSEDQPVSSLEMEVDRVRKKLLDDIKKAAMASAKGAEKLDEKEHRELLKRILLPLAYNASQIEAEAKRIATADAGKLKEMHEDAVQRSMLFELLDVMQMYRHWDVQEPIITEIVGDAPIELGKLKKLTEERIGDLLNERSKFLNNEKRASYEKRDNIAFFLVAVANLHVPPDHKELLYPRKLDNTKKIDPSRAEIVLGLVDYVNATNVLASIYQRLDDQARKRTDSALSGAGITMEGKTGYVPGYKSSLQKKQDALTDMAANIDELKKRIKNLEGQLESTKQLFEDDKKLSETMKSKLLAEKKITAKLVADLKKLETQLFQAQLDLADILEVNQGLEQKIADAERKLNKKGK
jgi:hypothetical protein